MEIHSYQGSLNPLWNSTARIGASEEPVSVALPAVPSRDIKPVFLLAMLHQHGRKAAWGAASRSHGARGQLYGHEIGFGGCRDFRLCLDEDRGWVGG
jgi:hypothetical protein